jgi:VanZ family protein
MQSNSLLNRLYNKIHEQTFLYLYVPLAIYWIAMFVGTSLPSDEIPQLFRAQDKFEHLFAYFGLAVMVYLWLHFQNKKIFLKKNALLFSILIILAYAAVDELHQMLVPGRVSDIIDWLADSIGGMCGVVMVYYFIKFNNVETELNA